MTIIYLFDWGDTLMVDFPEQQGKMCDWPIVQAVDGAQEVLDKLAEHHQVFVATNAAESRVSDIRAAFERVGLAQYISGYFCKANLGIGKGSPEFFAKIAQQLDVESSALVMIGDSLENDIDPALKAGLNAIWFNPSTTTELNQAYRQINCLREIYGKLA